MDSASSAGEHRHARRGAYVPRRPETTVLYRAVAGALDTFVARCDACRCERLVPFSCKRRGFCPSCGGRRMADTAATSSIVCCPRSPSGSGC